MESKDDIKSYAGFTIGPIYDVLSSARKTRELWFASYFFSWFMENIVEKLKEDNKIMFITPSVGRSEQKSITGKYHDRFILYSMYEKEGLFNEIKKAEEEALEYFVNIIDDLITNNKVGSYINGFNKNNIKSILNWYIQRNFVVFNRSTFESSGNIINEINRYLDSMEQSRTFRTGINEKTCFACKTLPALIKAPIWVKDPSRGEENKVVKDLCPLCYLKYFALDSDNVLAKIGQNIGFRFPSTFEISAVDFIKEINSEMIIELIEDGKDLTYESIKDSIPEDQKEFFKHNSYFNYIAILQADGDNLGKTIDDLRNLNEVKKLSETLFIFSNEAERLIKSYKGYPIYIGGDDILAFLPVGFKNGDIEFKTVFSLAKELSDSYDRTVKDNYKNTTLSIGINIAYYKFPLSIALKDARRQLFDVAKSVDGKNTLAIQFTTHSGHRLEFKIRFGTEEIEKFKELLEGILKGELDFPHSMHHNLSKYSQLMVYLAEDCQFDNFFENNFNEPIHSSTTTIKEGIMKIKDYLKLSTKLPNKDEKLRFIDETLKKFAFINFLRGEE